MPPPGIEEKIETAQMLCERWGKALKEDAFLAGKLGDLAAMAKASARACVETGVSDACRKCDEEEGGSCCGAGIENRYTPELLLINLLLGVTLPRSRHFEKSCYFLGRRGCILPARDILCINYLCARLQKGIQPGNLRRLQDTNGLEMETLFVLHDRVRNFIKQNTA